MEVAIINDTILEGNVKMEQKETSNFPSSETDNEKRERRMRRCRPSALVGQNELIA
jgi:hypothetical protein